MNDPTQLALYVLLATALGGLVLSGFVLGGREAPNWLALGHGGAGALGIVLLVLGGLSAGLSVAALLFLLAAAAGGLWLAHGPRSDSPELTVLLHGTAAVTGVIVVAVLLSRGG